MSSKQASGNLGWVCSPKHLKQAGLGCLDNLDNLDKHIETSNRQVRKSVCHTEITGSATPAYGMQMKLVEDKTQLEPSVVTTEKGRTEKKVLESLIGRQ